jgi:hypothetical protein
VVSFVSAPTYEANLTYSTTVTATTGERISTQTITVTVLQGPADPEEPDDTDDSDASDEGFVLPKEIKVIEAK